MLVVDGSASTGYREDVQTVFERIVERARDILSRDLDEDARRSRVRLILAGDRRPDPGLWRSPEEALGRADDDDRARPTEPLDLGAALGEVARRWSRRTAAGPVERRRSRCGS